MSHQSRSGINEKFTLTVVLGLLLTVFLVLCLGLIIYICKDRTKRKNSPSPSFESEQHQQMVSSKGQNKSEWIVHEIINFPKMNQIIWRIPALKYIGQKSFKFFGSYFGKLMISYIHSDLIWPLKRVGWMCAVK